MCVQREFGGGPLGPSALVESNRTGYKPSLLNRPTASAVWTRASGLLGLSVPSHSQGGVQCSALVQGHCLNSAGHGGAPAPTPPRGLTGCPHSKQPSAHLDHRAPHHLLLCPEGHLVLNLGWSG